MPKQIPGEPYTRLTVDEAADLHDDDNYAFVDVRRMDEYVDGHVKDALFITVDDLLGRIDELPEDKNLLFICAAGVRSGLACEMAAAMGIDPDRAVQHRGRHRAVDREGLSHQLRVRQVGCRCWLWGR